VVVPPLPPSLPPPSPILVLIWARVLRGEHKTPRSLVPEEGREGGRDWEGGMEGGREGERELTSDDIYDGGERVKEGRKEEGEE